MFATYRWSRGNNPFSLQISNFTLTAVTWGEEGIHKSRAQVQRKRFCAFPAARGLCYILTGTSFLSRVISYNTFHFNVGDYVVERAGWTRLELLDFQAQENRMEEETRRRQNCGILAAQQHQHQNRLRAASITNFSKGGG